MNAPVPLRPVVSAEEVAEMLHWSSAATFYTKRPMLEAKGFPPKLPGINGWSRAAVLRWIETNGQTYLPAMPEIAGGIGEGAIELERRYAR